MNLGNKISLICIQEMEPYWGTEYAVGKSYEGEIIMGKIELITNYEGYWKATKIGAASIEWVRKGYREHNMKEVVPEYLTHREVRDQFTIDIQITYLKVKSDLNKMYQFCALSKREICEKYNVDDVHTTTSMHLLDDYFVDTIQVRRDIALRSLLD